MALALELELPAMASTDMYNDSDDSDQSWLDQLSAKIENDEAQSSGQAVVGYHPGHTSIRKKRVASESTDIYNESDDSDQSWLDQIDAHIENDETQSSCQAAVGYHPGYTSNINNIVASQLGKGTNQLGKQRGQYTKRAKAANSHTKAQKRIRIATNATKATNCPTRAQKVATKFKDNLSFLTCACCPFSGPQDLFMSIEDFRKSNYAALKYNGIRKNNRVEQLLSKSTEQANAYAFEFQNAFSEFGLLKGLEYLCKRCRGGLAGSCPGNGEPVDVASMFGDVISNTRTRRNNRVSVSRMRNVGAVSDEDDVADDERDHLSNDESDMDQDDSENIEHELEHTGTKKRGKGSLDNSYLNGLYPGDVPEVLKCLNNIELSVIAKINTVTKVRLVGTSHYVATTPVYNIINNVLEIYDRLPRMPSEIDFATLRTHNGKIIKDYSFRPSKVIAALRWLKENNWLYSDIIIDCPREWIDEESGEPIDDAIPGPTIDLTEEETIELDIADHTNHSGHDAGGTALELLLMNNVDADITPTVQVLKEALDDADIGNAANNTEPMLAVDDLLQRVIERGGEVQFTDANKEEYLLEMSNPHLFPYGRGGPGDEFSSHLELQGPARVAKFAATALQGSGLFSRFQNDFRFIALCYYTAMRKRISGVSYAAHRTELDDVNLFDQQPVAPVGTLNQTSIPALDSESGTPQVATSLPLSVTTTAANNPTPTPLVADSNHVTVADITQLRDCLVNNTTPTAHLMRLVNRLSVYAHPLPGTSLFMMQERKFLHSAISSPIYDKHPWTYFISMGNCDLYEEHLFRCIFNDGNGNVVDYDGKVLPDLEGKQFLRDLTKAKRGQLLSRFPAFAVRMFKIKMEIILNDVLGGKDGSLGDQFDYWARVEFSRSQNAHLHVLQSIRNGLRYGDSIAISKDSERIIPQLNDMIKATCTAKLIPSSASLDTELPAAFCQPCYETTEPSEVCMTPFKTWNCARFPSGKEFEWRPCNCGSGGDVHGSRTQAFTDAEDPRRLPFNGDLDYTFRDGVFVDSRVQNLCRNLQLANQVHYCCFTCFKYNAKCICRFMFPRVMAELRSKFKRDYAEAADPVAEGLSNCYLATRKDGRTRKRIVVVPPVNNAHLNNHPSDPVFIAAHHGNSDVKYMPESTGTVEYCTSYSSKAEKQDFDTIANVFAKRIAGINRAGKEMTDLQKLNTVGNAIINSEKASATQMIMVLCSLKFIEYNRPRENVNPLRRDLIRIRVLPSQVRQFAADSQSALSTGINSHFGRRDAYSVYLKEVQALTGGDIGSVTYYTFRTAYTTQAVTQRIEKKVSCLSAALTVDTETGFIAASNKSFRIDSYYYVRRRKDAVIHCTPHIPIDYNDENSCYAILLLHHPWPGGEEKNIVPDGVTAAYHLAELMRQDHLLPHVRKTLNGIKQSEAYLAQQREDMIMEGHLQEDGLVQPTVHDDEEHVGASHGGEDGNESDGGIDFEGLVVSDGESDDQDDNVICGATVDNRVASEMLNLSRRGTSLNREERAVAKSCIEHARQLYAERNKLINTDSSISASGQQAFFTPQSIVFESASYIPIDNHNELLEALEKRLETFNDEQWMAYNRAKMYLEATRNGNEEQLLMFMSGEGGCGKSYVIEAIDMLGRLMFGKGRGKYGPIVKWAPTGSSGYNIGGCTWQSGCKMCGYNDDNINYRGIGLDLFDAYAIVIDEISMIGLEDLWKMSDTVAKARATQFTDEREQARIRDLPFGGLHVIFCGDFFQLPPPGRGRTPIYEPYPKTDKGKKGKAIWDQLTAYVCLVENKRISGSLEPQDADDREALEDMWFASTLSLLRQGHADMDTLAYLNRHCLMASRTYNPRTQHPDAVWLSPLHEVTKQVNEAAFKNLVEAGKFHYKCIALHDQGGGPLPSMERLKACFKVTNPNAKMYGATHIDLAIGMRVKLHDNLAPELALFNGATGTVVDIAFPDYVPPDKHELLPNSSVSMAKLANDHRPLPIVSVKIDNDKLDTTLFPDRIVKFAPVKRHLHGKGQHAISRLQLPLTPCHASTVHSAQGLTAKSPGGIIYDQGGPGCRRFAFGLAYVALSRCRKLKDLKLARPLELKDFSAHERTRDKIKEEYERLERCFPQNKSSSAVLKDRLRMQKTFRAQLLLLDLP